MTRATRRPVALTAATCVGLLVAGNAPAAPAPAVVPPPSSAPASPLDRLQQLDQLHADLELAKLRAAIAKANAEARDAAAGPVLGAAGAPPLPQIAPNGAMLNLPQLSPPGPSTERGKDKGKARADGAEAPLFTLVEAWGAGADRQAILHSEAGDRLVHVGDQIPPGVVTAISGGAVTYRDPHGQTHAIN